MRKLLLLGLLLTAAISGKAQTGSAQQAINEQVWRPFITAYNALDADAFMAVHTSDVLRIIRDSDKILAGNAYRQDMERNTAGARQRGSRRQIELRFTERFAQGNHAFETGYYKVVTRYSETEQYEFYGKFHVVLRKENGRWKIMLDSDTSQTENGPVTEKDFAGALPME
jgi:ketosteroid isomerase-like protein